MGKSSREHVMFHEQSSKSGVEACPADKVQRVGCTFPSVKEHRGNIQSSGTVRTREGWGGHEAGEAVKQARTWDLMLTETMGAPEGFQ